MITLALEVEKEEERKQMPNQRLWVHEINRKISIEEGFNTLFTYLKKDNIKCLGTNRKQLHFVKRTSHRMYVVYKN